MALLHAHLDPVRPLRLPWLSHTTPTRHGFLPSGPVCIFPSGLLLDVRQGSLKTRGWILRVLTRSPSGCCRLRAGHLDRASPCGLGFPTARWQGSQAKCQEKISGESNGTPLQYSCLENPMDRVAEGRTLLSEKAETLPANKGPSIHGYGFSSSHLWM